MDVDVENLSENSSGLNKELQLLFTAIQENPERIDEVMERLKLLHEQYTDTHKLSLARLRILADAGRHENALLFASKIIPLLLSAELDSLAVLAYRFLGKSKTDLELSPEFFQKLGRALREAKDFRGAAWNYCRATEQNPNIEESTKICLQMASEAEQNDKPEEALAIYRFFLAKYPATPMLDFIKSSMEFQELKIARNKEEAEIRPPSRD